VHPDITFNGNDDNQQHPTGRKRIMSLTNTKAVASKTLAAATILGLALVANTGGAQAYGQKKIDQVQAEERARIEQGRYEGSLTRREYRDLQAEQRAIQDMETRAKADGHISKREYRNIREAQQNASRHIYQETHDGQVSWYRKWLYNHRY
jgi:uncharacterized membrane protein YebE (DUF533 family)